MKQTRLPHLTEEQFLGQILQLAKLHRWLAFHARPGRTARGWRTCVSGDGVGWPDLFLVRGPVACAVELKVGSRKATPEQLVWLQAFRAAGIPAYLWYPADWPAIERVLSAPVAPSRADLTTT